MGERYGEPQASGLSPTHEEYREAREEDKVLAFIQRGVIAEPRQQSLIDEVEQWEGGHYVSHFTTAADLRSAVTKALHQFELERVVGPVDEAEILERAMACFSATRSYSTVLEVVVAGGPRRPVVRAGDLPGGELADMLAEMAVTGPTRLFPVAGSGETTVIDGRLTFYHQRGAISLDELGTIAVAQELNPASERRFQAGLTPIIHEVVEEGLAGALHYASLLLDRVDSAARISTVVPVARLTGGIGAWMSRRDAEANRTGAIALNARTDAPPVHLMPNGRRRPSLSADNAGISRDLAARLREAALAGRGPFR